MVLDLLKDLDRTRTALALTEQRAAEAERVAARLQRELDEERASSERLRRALADARWGVGVDEELSAG